MDDQVQREPNASRRLSAWQQFERLVFVVAFAGLALTGLAQKFAGETWGQFAITLLGGIESARILHRFFALLLIAAAIFHLLELAYRRWVLGRRSPFPSRQDWRNLGQQTLYSLGLRPRPATDQFAFHMEYLALVISVAILILTGLALWKPIVVTTQLPGETIPVARSIHSNQALLIVIFVIVWQILMVVWRHPRSETSPAEAEQAVSADLAARRRQRFLPLALLIAVLLGAGLMAFLTYEPTAIDTVPRREAIIFAPQTMPQTGDPHVGLALWTTLRCAFCHGDQASGGLKGEPALRGRGDLTFEAFYQQVRQGDDIMPAFSREELPDGYLVHLWAWLSETPPQ